MFLAAPPASPYDLHFRLVGIRVRVAPWFWLVAVLLGWNLKSLGDQPGVTITLWVGAVFLSILIHEMGHALAMRYYGISSSIVLYHFGGLAIPDQYSTMPHGSRRSRQDPISEIVISAAGPGAQIGLAIVLIIVVRLSGYASAAYLHMMSIPSFVIEFIPWLSAGRPMTAGTTQLFLFFLVLTSVFWALLNLLPVYPLDGGQIARNTFTIFNPREGIRYSLMLSIITGAGVAFYGFTSNNFFLGIMFAMLAYSSFQVLQAYSGRGGY